MSFPVVLDACVLIPMPITDLLLRLATAKQFRPLWSDEILDEVERNLVGKLSKEPSSARRRVDAMRNFFPDALVENYESLVPGMTNDLKDRHVLAAAVRAGAELIVTFNGKDFPATSLRPYDIGVRSTDDFLLDQLDLDTPTVCAIAHEVVTDMRNPKITWGEYLHGLSQAGLPLFANELAQKAPSFAAGHEGAPQRRFGQSRTVDN
ncbi:PIN domain-containing protein [Kocuria atrinae]|uniref:PIN domain-containing protein n=1 Tax=Kocuria atrinae TaxID=592377 RepID=UPI001CB9ADD1|nr:PIN domain-containing protein [Kocuria atrinae]